MSLKKFLQSLLSLIYPDSCLYCQDYLSDSVAKSLRVCQRCLDNILWNKKPFCQRCGRSLYGRLSTIRYCQECNHRRFYFNRAWSILIYDGLAKDAINMFKFKKRLSFTYFFLALMEEFIHHNPEIINEISGILCVPLHPLKKRERGFNQSELLAKGLADRFNLRNLCGTLIRTRYTSPQTELNRTNRIKNVKDAFVIKRGYEHIKKSSLLLIDDVFTSGATVNECAKVLKSEGAKTINILTLARGM